MQPCPKPSTTILNNLQANHPKPSKTTFVQPYKTTSVQPSSNTSVQPSKTTPVQPSKTTSAQPPRTTSVQLSKNTSVQPSKSPHYNHLKPPTVKEILSQLEMEIVGLFKRPPVDEWFGPSLCSKNRRRWRSVQVTKAIIVPIISLWTTKLQSISFFNRKLES